MVGLAVARVKRGGLWALGAVLLAGLAVGGAEASTARGWLRPLTARAAATIGGDPAGTAEAPSPGVPALNAPGTPRPADDVPDAALPSTVAPVASYTLTARLDADAHTIHGQGTLTWRNTSRASVSDLYFHLYLNAFADDQSLFNRSPFTRARSGKAPQRWGSITLERLAARELGGADLLSSLEPHTPGDPRDRTDRRLVLPEPVAPGETLTIELAWSSVLPDI